MKNIVTVKGYNYFQCKSCGSIYIDTQIIDKIDNGFGIVQYTDNYWETELADARERAYGVALARMAEAFYYSRIPIKRFLDIGSGPGYFLDAVSKYLPNSEHIFYAIEKFPPPSEFITKSENYLVGDLSDVNLKFDGGICIEVIEHITPNMLKNLLMNLAKVSNEGAFYIFNTGMPDYVLKEDMGYLDPIRRGHIVSYSLKAIEKLAKGMDFTVFPLIGKSWAFGIEYKTKSTSLENIQDRIWTALPDNLNILCDKDMGSVLRILGLETSRAYR
ncbi:methyltransferase domain-containing protein [Aneurinibacillus soli]|uniref:methyltransferase domain-containing protein n=1 Tax=Aneurinibacillus soli TaxID=1500254 RepID=UPI001E3323BD|nr:methyltransferase domain-containing protein [Aneurinibacillus soli]